MLRATGQGLQLMILVSGYLREVVMRDTAVLSVMNGLKAEMRLLPRSALEGPVERGALF